MSKDTLEHYAIRALELYASDEEGFDFVAMMRLIESLSAASRKYIDHYLHEYYGTERAERMYLDYELIAEGIAS